MRPLKNHDTLAMVVVFGTKTNLAVEYTLFFRGPNYTAIAAMILFTACAPFLQAADYFTDDGFDAPFKTMQHPSSEYYNGVTYIAYQGNHEDA